MKTVFVALPQPDVKKYNIQKTQEDIELAVKFLLNDEDVKFIYNDHAWVSPNNEIKHIGLMNDGHHLLELANCDLFVTLDVSWRYPDIARINTLAAGCREMKILRLPTEYFAPELYVEAKYGSGLYRRLENTENDDCDYNEE